MIPSAVMKHSAARVSVVFDVPMLGMLPRAGQIQVLVVPRALLDVHDRVLGRCP